MENNDHKGQTIFLSVVGVATLLVALVGATFAFFSTQLNGEAGQQSVTTATVSELVFTATGFDVPAQNILPGKVLGTRQFEVASKEPISAGIDIKYDCEISSTNNGITDLEYRVSSADQELSAEEWIKVPTSATSIFGPGKATLNNGNQRDVYKVELRFPETGADQNLQQGKEATVNFACKLADGEIIYYNDANQQGTGIQPSGK